jgi:ribonuclease Z
MQITAYSKALYSNWIYLENLRVLLDVGEGINNVLEGRLLGVHDLFISHGHTDHFTGLHSMLGIRIREAVKGEQQVSPLRIHYPARSPSLDLYLEYLSKSIYIWDQIVELVPLEAGDKVTLRDFPAIEVTALEVCHNPRELCLGFRFSQKRWKLKPEVLALPPEEMRDIVRTKPREEHSEVVEFPLITYSGDGLPLEDEGSQGVELLLHEATFLDPDTSRVHSRLSEAIERFRALEARSLMLWHLSTRYTHDEIQEALNALTTEEERKQITVVFPGKVTAVTLPVSGV